MSTAAKTPCCQGLGIHDITCMYYGQPKTEAAKTQVECKHCVQPAEWHWSDADGNEQSDICQNCLETLGPYRDKPLWQFTPIQQTASRAKLIGIALDLAAERDRLRNALELLTIVVRNISNCDENAWYVLGRSCPEIGRPLEKAEAVLAGRAFR